MLRLSEFTKHTLGRIPVFVLDFFPITILSTVTRLRGYTIRHLTGLSGLEKSVPSLILTPVLTFTYSR